jgi:hypothetical protein
VSVLFEHEFFGPHHGIFATGDLVAIMHEKDSHRSAQHNMVSYTKQKTGKSEPGVQYELAQIGRAGYFARPKPLCRGRKIAQKPPIDECE